jgi:hypothetical protein
LTLMHQTLPQNFHDLSKDASKIDGNLKRSWTDERLYRRKSELRILISPY